MGFLGAKVTIPPPSGAHGIGTTRFEVSEAGYVDPYAPSPTPRRVPVQAWYPAVATDGAKEPYLDDELRAALSALTHVPKFLLKQNPSRSVVKSTSVLMRFFRSWARATFSTSSDVCE